MAQGHKADEYISIAQTERCMTMLRQLCAWMRAEPAEPLALILNTGTQAMHNQHSPHIDQTTIDRWQADGAVLLKRRLYPLGRSPRREGHGADGQPQRVWSCAHGDPQRWFAAFFRTAANSRIPAFSELSLSQRPPRSRRR